MPNNKWPFTRSITYNQNAFKKYLNLIAMGGAQPRSKRGTGAPSETGKKQSSQKEVLG